MNAQTSIPPRAADAARLASILYRSTATISREAFEASGAPTAFAAANRARDLTGYLHLEDGVFYQHLEGPADALSRLWRMIEADPRHCDATLISRGAIGCRRFAQWAMGYDSRGQRSLFDWTARSGLSLKGTHYPKVLTGFLEYASAATRMAS